ncbi:UPF0728 protein C10orf53 homolog [Bacillus rossius redtenbacheri]|uniref:UPF0728 protein C10orf53 homolog n=1 Tax=Bacillus rossius redtenbacheri TaxID=93214 RepID=UPI002FDD9AB8
MPARRAVEIHYGPCELFGIIRHRTLRLSGLKEQLTKAGCDVTLQPSADLERVEVIVNGYSVFRCGIRYLQFNNDGEDDPLARGAAHQVLDFLARLELASQVGPCLDDRRLHVFRRVFSLAE